MNEELLVLACILFAGVYVLLPRMFSSWARKADDKRRFKKLLEREEKEQLDKREKL